MKKMQKYLWVINAIVAGLIGPLVAPIVMRIVGSSDAAFAVAGTLGYLGALTCELSYIVLSEHYTRCRRSRRARQLRQSRLGADNSQPRLL